MLNESSAIAMRRFSLERETEAVREKGKAYCILCVEVELFIL
jgi:hypothetical protein